MQKILATVAAVVVACLLSAHKAEAAPIALVQVLPSLTESFVGDALSVGISIGDVTDLFDYQFDINFNPAVLRADALGDGAWVGLKNFQTLFSSPLFYQVLANTLIISGMKILFVFPVPIIVALLLNEIRSGKFRGMIQSAIYLPHFLSWVVIAGVFIALLSPTDGAVNQIQTAMGFAPVNYMTNTGTIRWVLVISEIWRSAGWDSLLYLAAIFAIDPQLYEAAELDGASRWQKIRHVTIPGIVPTIATLFILNMGMFLSADLNQVVNMQNAVNASTIDILDTYVYRMGLFTGEYALATAAGLFKAVIGMALVLISHFISKRLTGKGVW